VAVRSEEVLRLFAKPADAKTVLSDFINPSVSSDLQFTDIMPNIYDTLNSMRHLLQFAAKGTLKYPHGRPQLGGNM
jgi:hypothetical protein